MGARARPFGCLCPLPKILGRWIPDHSLQKEKNRSFAPRTSAFRMTRVRSRMPAGAMRWRHVMAKKPSGSSITNVEDDRGEKAE